MTARLLFSVVWVIVLTILVGTSLVPAWSVLFLLPFALVGAVLLEDERDRDRERP